MRESNMKKLRFTVEKSRDPDGYYWDVVDNHMLRDRRVVGWYTVEDTDGTGLNYGYDAAEELALDLNNKYGYLSYDKHYNMSKLNSEAS
jgi:hypothetical protein